MEDFAVFARLREARKNLAAEEARKESVCHESRPANRPAEATRTVC